MQNQEKSEAWKRGHEAGKVWWEAIEKPYPEEMNEHQRGTEREDWFDGFFRRLEEEGHKKP